MRAVRAAVAAGLVLAGTGALLAPTQAAGPCSSTGTVGKLAASWQTLTPKFTAGPAAVMHVAAPQYAPDLLYATNGVQVVRSTDAGCGWKVVLDLGDLLGTGTAPTIVSLHAPSSANGSRYVYVAAQADIAVLSQPRTWISPDRGETWSSADETDGLPVVGTVPSLTASPRLPQVGYALVSGGVAGQHLRGTVWATTDGGDSWVQRTPTGQSVDASILRAGPLQENQLLALSGGTLVSSGDGGASFHGVGLDATDVTSFDQAGDGGGIRLVAGHSGSSTISRSDDGGASWTRVKTPVIAERVAMGPLLGAVAIGSQTGTWLLVNPFVTDNLTTPGAQPDELQVSAPSATGFAVTGVRAGAVVRAAISLDGAPLPPGLRPVRLLPFDPLHQFPSTLTPVHTRVELPPGGTTRVPYTLLLPRTPSPLDVMFLIDTTGSMGGVIDGLRQGITAIANTLNNSGLDVRIGLGDFKDYANPYGGGDASDYPYRLDRRIGFADDSLRRAIETLSASGGGDPEESALTALVESATGRGETVDGVRFVAPGGQAGYRPRTLRLDVLSTDSTVHKRGQRHGGDLAARLGYTLAETVSTLKKANVHAVGLAAGSTAEPDLRWLARGTGTLAPAGGVDCNGDGTRDVRQGDPLVCTLDGTSTGASAGGVGAGVGAGTGTGTGTVNLAGAVIGLAEALPDRQRVSLRVSQGSSYAELLGKTVRNKVNLKADNELSYVLQLSCPARSGSGSHAIELAAKAAARQVATASVELVCGATPRRAGLAVAGLIDPPGVDPKGAPAPPGQPPQAPNPNPNPNPNANPNVNPNLNANFGAATQEQQTQQLALVHSDAAAPTEELAMSRAAPGPPAGLLVSTAGLMFVAACAFAVRARPAAAQNTS